MSVRADGFRFNAERVTVFEVHEPTASNPRIGVLVMDFRDEFTAPVQASGTCKRFAQLPTRALENGIRIRVVPVDYRGRTHWGVDSPEDLARCEDLIRQEGELVPAVEGLR